MAGSPPNLHKIRWTPGQHASRMCSTSRSRSEVTWYAHFLGFLEWATPSLTVWLVYLKNVVWNFVGHQLLHYRNRINTQKVETSIRPPSCILWKVTFYVRITSVGCPTLVKISWTLLMLIITRRCRDSLVVSALDQGPRGRGFEPSAGHGRSRSNRRPVALCTLGLGLLNPPSSRGR